MSTHIALARDQFLGMVEANSIAAQAAKWLATLEAGPVAEEVTPNERGATRVEFPTPHIVHVVRQGGRPSYQRVFDTWQGLTALGLLKGRMYCRPDHLPVYIISAHHYMAICGRHLGVGLTVDEAEIALHLPGVLSEPSAHERRWTANQKALVDGEAD